MRQKHEADDRRSRLKQQELVIHDSFLDEQLRHEHTRCKFPNCLFLHHFSLPFSQRSPFHLHHHQGGQQPAADRCQNFQEKELPEINEWVGRRLSKAIQAAQGTASRARRPRRTGPMSKTPDLISPKREGILAPFQIKSFFSSICRMHRLITRERSMSLIPARVRSTR